ncbi:two pore channel protein 2-like [Saccoglossus kowalevskii]
MDKYREGDPILRDKPSAAFYDDEDTCSIQSGGHDHHIDHGVIRQAVVFLEDAVNYRSIKHKVDFKSLKLYQFYYSKSIQRFLFVSIALLLLLAFFERPSSLTTGFSADPRYVGDRLDPPCGITESIEFVLLLLFLFDVILKGYFIGRQQFLRSPWLVAYAVIVMVSFADLLVSVVIVCNEFVRIRRLLRPFFLLQNSSLMKKTVRSIKRTLPEIFSVLLLLLLHMYIFTIFGMLLFPKPMNAVPPTPGANNTTLPTTVTNDHREKIEEEGLKQFSSLMVSFMSLLVLLTTANNPDVMIPAYTYNRFYSLYFIIFLVIGMYFFLNMLTAVIYNQFRGYLLSSMQASYFRRRLAIRAAFEVLKSGCSRSYNPGRRGTVPVNVTRNVVMHVKMRKTCKKTIIRELDTDIGGTLNTAQFQEVFDQLNKDTTWKRKPEIRYIENGFLRKIQYCIAHQYFNYFGNLVALANVICITVELGVQYEKKLNYSASNLAVTNFVFVWYYVIEQVMKVWALGWRRYISSKSNLFDAAVTITLVVVEIIHCILNGSPFSIESTTFFLPMMHIFVKNFLSTTSLMVIYYFFAILGIELFKDVIVYQDCKNTTNSSGCGVCGSWQQLEYWPNNFDDFAAALVVLWNIMVVNNWMVFLEEFSVVTSPDENKTHYNSKGSWNFITKWDRHQLQLAEGLNEEEMITRTDVHSMFRDLLKEPTEEELLTELRMHPHLHLRL